MFEKILLPLDGSELAESVIPYGEELASRLGSEIILFHVCGVEHKQYHRMHGLYLEGIAEGMRQDIKRRRAKAGAAKVSAETLMGEPVQTIHEYVEKNNIGLMVMASSGASGLKLWMLGSVADKAFRAVSIPTMLVRAGAEAPSKKKLMSRILVPLDGSEASQLVLPVVEDLALKLKAGVTLFQMASREYVYAAPMEAGGGGIDYGKDYGKMEAAEKKRVQANLLKVERALRQKGVAVTHRSSIGTDAADAIISMEQESGADLVVMATRGASPVKRWVMGSTAEKVLRQGELPIILVRK